MSTLVLLDTNSYLRLAKRVRPFVGRQFGQKPYVITILKAVEDEVHAGARLKFQYPWFDNDEFASERLANAIRLSASDRKSMEIAQGVLHGMAQAVHYICQNIWRKRQRLVERYCSGNPST